MTLRAAIPVLAALIAGAAPGHAAEREVLAPLAKKSPVSAYGGVVAWSEYDPTSERFHLVVRSGGRTRRLPVRPRVVAFDVDLGPGPKGEVTAVYSRCSDDIPAEMGGWPHDGPANGLRCDVYRVRVDGGRERRIDAVSRRRTSESLPSLWRNRLVYARGRSLSRPRILVTDLRSGRTRELPGGSRGPAAGAGAIDLRGKEVVYGWTYWGEDCTDPQREHESTAVTHSEIWWDRLDGGHRRIAKACTRSLRRTSVALPSLGSRGLTYQITSIYPEPFRICTLSSPGAAGRERSFAGSPFVDLAATGSAAYAVGYQTDGDGYELIRLP